MAGRIIAPASRNSQTRAPHPVTLPSSQNSTSDKCVTTLKRWRRLVSLPLRGHTNKMSSLPVASAASATLDSLLSQPLGGMRGMERPATCCCGREQCAYLEHNKAALEGLEKDLQSAAQIGQVSAHFGCSPICGTFKNNPRTDCLTNSKRFFCSTTCLVHEGCPYSQDLRARCLEVLGLRFARWLQICR